jgi:hypothetical protein
MRDRLFLSTNYGLIPVVAKDSKEDERFVFLEDSTGLFSVEFAKETVNRYLRGEINRLVA